MSQKPTFLLITGSFALPSFYDLVTRPITTQGYQILTPHLPSAGFSADPQDREPPSMYDDARLIASEIQKLADEGKDVILIAHSYGGVPASESMKGLGKAERTKEGKSGGVVRIAYLTALVPDVGATAAEVLAEVPKEQKSEFEIDEKGWMRHKFPQRSAAIIFSDLPASEGLSWMMKFPCHSAVSFGDELTYAGYKDVPVSWLLCEGDLCIPAKNQREAIALIERINGKEVDVRSIQTGHCPTVTKPDVVVEWILDLAGKF